MDLQALRDYGVRLVAGRDSRTSFRPHERRIAGVTGAVLLLCATGGSGIAIAESLCQSCELQAGIGDTYHFWGMTGGLVLPFTVIWNDARYELGFFRVTKQQVLVDASCPNGRVMADPFWGMSLSRRWQLHAWDRVRVFFGFGLSAKTESDQLSSTRLDFASQLGLRFRLPGNRLVGELTMRHWSNGGIRLPNHGEDFLTLTVRVNTGRFGVDRNEQIAVGRFPERPGLTSGIYP